MSAPAGLFSTTVNLLRLGRPLHLVGGTLFYTLGVAAAQHSGTPINATLAVVGWAVVMAGQLLNHYSNDYYDIDADTANPTPTRWSGGSRVLPNGALPTATARTAMLSCAVASIVGVIVLMLVSPTPLPSALLALLGVGMAWIYSSPPIWLNRRTLGEVSGAILIPGLTGLLGYQLQAGALGALPFLIAAPLCLLQFAMLLAVNLPDAVGDAAVGKRTLVVVLGRERTKPFYVSAIVGAYLLLPLLVVAGLDWRIAMAALGALPIAIGLLIAIGRGAWLNPHTWEGLNFWSIGLLMATAMLMLVALIFTSRW